VTQHPGRSQGTIRRRGCPPGEQAGSPGGLRQHGQPRAEAPLPHGIHRRDSEQAAARTRTQPLIPRSPDGPGPADGSVPEPGCLSHAAACHLAAQPPRTGEGRGGRARLSRAPAVTGGHRVGGRGVTARPLSGAASRRWEMPTGTRPVQP